MREFFIWLSACSMAVSFLPAAGIAEERSEEEVLFMDVPVVVTASKKVEKVTVAPSNITVVTEQQIREWGVRDLKDVLRRVAGYLMVYDRDEWVFGSRGNVGNSNVKYLMLIDGHRVNSIENHGPGEMIELPNDLSNVKRIEIIRGPGSAIWGADALVGVINIITKDASDLAPYSRSLTIKGGSEETYGGNFQIGKNVNEETSMLLMGSFVKSDGKRITVDSSSTNPICDSTTGFSQPPFGRFTTALDKYDPSYMLQLKARSGELSINAYSFHSRIYHRQYEIGKGRTNWFNNDRTFLEGIWNKNYADKTLLEWRISTDDIRGEKLPETGKSTHQLWMDRRVSSSLDVTQNFFEMLNLTAGADGAFTKTGPDAKVTGLDPSDPTSTTGTKGSLLDKVLNDTSVGGYAIFEIIPLNCLHLFAGGRFDYNNTRGDNPTNINPRAAMIWNAVEKTTFKLVYNTGFLRPAAYQAQSPTPISSERMRQIDLIWMQGWGPVKFTTTIYWQKLKGNILIRSYSNDADFFNSGDNESVGSELEAAAEISRQLTAWANASYNQGRGDNFNSTTPADIRRVYTDGTLLNYPTFMGNVGLGWKPYKFLSISPATRYTGVMNYRQTPAVSDVADATYKEVGPFIYVDLNIVFVTPGEDWSFSIYGSNLTNVTTPAPLSVQNGTYDQYGFYGEARVNYKW